MKAYGLKRYLNFKYPDLADCLEIGAPSQLMKMKSKTRRTARRIHKKKERSLQKHLTKGEMYDRLYKQ
jgi:hypothetical protein